MTMTRHTTMDILDKTPRSVYGLSFNADWKGFFAGIFFQGVSGASINLMSKASNFMPFNQGKDASSARMEAMSTLEWTSDTRTMTTCSIRVCATIPLHTICSRALGGIVMPVSFA